MTYESVYIITWKPEYLRLANQDETGSYRVVVRLSQGGFGEGVSDFVKQVKERYLAYELGISMVNLPITEETFDQYFLIEEAREVVDLDEGDE